MAGGWGAALVEVPSAPPPPPLPGPLAVYPVHSGGRRPPPRSAAGDDNLPPAPSGGGGLYDDEHDGPLPARPRPPALRGTIRGMPVPEHFPWVHAHAVARQADPLGIAGSANLLK